MSFKLFKLIFVCCLPLVYGKVEVIVEERFEDCSEPGKGYGLLDITEFNLVALSDYEIFLNGSVKYPKGVKSPWRIRIYGEKFHRGQWSVYGYDKQFSDFCKDMHKPNTVWYPYFKNFDECPLKPGSEFKYDMVPLKLPIVDLCPPNFQGDWRTTLIGTYEVNGVEETDCYRAYARLIDTNYG